MSRTSGVPVGPESWEPEALGDLDIAATVAELITVVGCVMQLWTVSDRHRSSAGHLPGLTR